MLNFAIGPVMSDPNILEVASRSTPYFRTEEFSEIMKENERIVLDMMNAPEGSRCAFLTASGTGAMESVVMNVLNNNDKAIIINGGGFGQRFVDLCNLHMINATEVKCDFGCQIHEEQLRGLENHTALLVNMNETSSGLLYNMKLLSKFCKENNILLIIDAISAFIADEMDMKELGAGVVIASSQKALSIQPGISIVALSPQAIERIINNNDPCMYLSLKLALENGERGQTPFTPAVTILLQINKRLHNILSIGGICEERKRIEKTAKLFRSGIENLGLECVPESPSNALTCLRTSKRNAKEIVERMKEDYQIWVCPNGGIHADDIFRIGHIGNIDEKDNVKLIEAFQDLNKRSIL